MLFKKRLVSEVAVLNEYFPRFLLLKDIFENNLDKIIF